MLDLKRLRILREVAAAGSFSAAAESLYVSQSAVSQQIAALEAEVSVPLLLRLRSGPVLTDAGSLLVSHADAAICRLEQAERELADLSGLGSGQLRLISFPSASATIGTAAATELRRLHPEIQLSLAEADPEISIPALKRGDHDLALVYDFELNPFEPERDLELTLLLTERMHVVLPPTHRLAGQAAIDLADLEGEQWLGGNLGGSCRELTVLSCLMAGFEPEISFETSDYNVMQSMIAAGLGVTLLPDLALAFTHPGVKVIPVTPKAPVRRVWAASLTAGSRSAATDAMLEVLVAVGAGFEPSAPALAA
jgi:DNA-binding transcriptional LysR family regulator